MLNHIVRNYPRRPRSSGSSVDCEPLCQRLNDLWDERQTATGAAEKRRIDAGICYGSDPTLALFSGCPRRERGPLIIFWARCLAAQSLCLAI